MPVSVSSEQVPPGDLAALLKVSLELSDSLDLDVVMQRAIEGVVEVLGLDTGAIYTVEGDQLYLGATTPALPPDFPDRLRAAPLSGHPHIVEALSTHAPVFVADIGETELTSDEQAAADARGLRSVLYVPLIAKGRAEGVVIVGTQDGTPVTLSGSDVDLCYTLSMHVALSLANARLYEQAQRSADELWAAYDATLEGWSRALELRDEETSGHTQRSAALAAELAMVLGMSPEEVVHVRHGALLHDIGKMAVPDAILHKPGPLDDDEWVVMRRHPVYARDFLDRIEYLKAALDIPYCHHERWDGTGYPQGLAGEEIPLAARIFAVIDVFDALTSDRPYRKAWEVDDALAYIRANSGTQFDPRVVDAFLERVGEPLE